MTAETIAPGARVRIRGAEWLVQRVDRASNGDQVLDVIGLSELVADTEARFLRSLEEKQLEIINPADTRLRLDESPSFRSSLLYMESLLRKKVPTDDRLHIGPEAAIDSIPYQWDPALQALQQPRQRILIADATGLGKTMEAGILMSELIERGRGKRILVVALKSMMTQLQKELWTRFTIPLMRLDSQGIQRIRKQIPANHNPFYYYDKTIISIDTLKRGAEYRTHIEEAEWDIVVVDEAQNAAKRGNTPSQRHDLARRLAQSCDTMIMLSATPHDGSPRSFASLMNMLDPTAIANPEDYTRDDIEGLFIRRFKNDIRDQVDTAFLDRDVDVCVADTTAVEEAAYDTLAELSFTAIDNEGSGDVLFKTTLEKALLSSPAACIETIDNRIERLKAEGSPAYKHDIEQLQRLADQLRPIGAKQFSKYQRLLGLLRDPSGLSWDGSDPEDRLVIFSERLETIRFLAEHLAEDLTLDAAAIQTLHGGMSDVEQQEIVEDFGRTDADVRLLLTSDIGAEGINLHYLSHRLIHFDIPWSLMLFQQRNGRIDRYGQTHAPQIRYMVADSKNAKMKGDMRILEVLIRKEQQAEANIDDPASLMGVYNIEKEERITADAIETGTPAETFEDDLAPETDIMDLLLGRDEATENVESAQDQIAEPVSLFTSDFDYLRTALAHFNEAQDDDLDTDLYPERQTVRLTATDEIKQRFARLPREVWPTDGVFWLSGDPDEVQDSIVESRKRDRSWPDTHYLWKHHPLLRWVDDKVVANFQRKEAPVLALSTLNADTTYVLCSGNVPNRKGQAVVNDWVGVRFTDGYPPRTCTLDEVLRHTELASGTLPNRAPDLSLEALHKLIPAAVEEARTYMGEKRNAVNKQLNDRLQTRLNRLDTLKDRHKRQLHLEFAKSDRPESIVEGEKQRKLREIDRVFQDFYDWMDNSMTIEKQVYIQVIAVLTGIDA